VYQDIAVCRAGQNSVLYMTEPDILSNEMVRDASRGNVIDKERKGGPTFFRRRTKEGKSSRSL